MTGFRYGLRTSVQNPGLTAAVILTLALGIGATTTVFSAFDALLLRMLPVKAPEQLHVLYDVTPNETDRAGVSWPLFLRLKEAAAGKADLMAVTGVARFHGSISQGAIEPVTGELVSGEFFEVLGVQPALGRLFAPEDNRAVNSHPVVVLSHRFWERRFQAKPEVLGNTLTLNGAPLTIIGVAEDGFSGVSVGESPDVWAPLMMQPAVKYAQNAASFGGADTRKPWPPQDYVRWLHAIARVPGKVESAAAVLSQVFQRDLAAIAATRNDERERALVLQRRLELRPGGQGFARLRERMRGPLNGLMAMTGLMLLIACANVANLLLARAASRKREMAVRLSLGATRGQIVRQVLMESILLAFAGGVGGVLIAVWSGQLVSRLLSLGFDLSVDFRVLAFSAAVCLSAGLLFGIAPALRLSAVRPSDALKSGGSPGFSGRLTLGRSLVIVQIAASVLLVTTAGLLARSVWNLLHVDVGFDRERVITVRIDPRGGGYEENQLPALYQRITDRMKRLPGVSSAVVSVSSIAGGGMTTSGVHVPGYVPHPRESTSILENYVDPGYFAAIGMQVLQGRDFDARDGRTTLPVAVINEAMARHYFPGTNPIGRRYGYGPQHSGFEIIGIVRDARIGSLRSIPRPMAYRPLAQELQFAQSLEVRTTMDTRSVLPLIRAALAEAEPKLPVVEIATLAGRLRRTAVQEERLAQLSAFFAAAALLLASIGIYGVVSYSAARRTTEIGVRLAMGAPRSSILRLFLLSAGRLALAGLAIGLTMLFLVSRWLRSYVFGVNELDTVTTAGAAALMLTLALAAAYLPARRAAITDPITALRHE